MKYILLSIFLVLLSVATQAQIPDAVYSPRIKTVLLHQAGNQLGAPIMKLGAMGALELHFDDLDANVKNYSYTF